MSKCMLYRKAEKRTKNRDEGRNEGDEGEEEEDDTSADTTSDLNILQLRCTNSKLSESSQPPFS